MMNAAIVAYLRYVWCQNGMFAHMEGFLLKEED